LADVISWRFLATLALPAILPFETFESFRNRYFATALLDSDREDRWSLLQGDTGQHYTNYSQLVHAAVILDKKQGFHSRSVEIKGRKAGNQRRQDRFIA
jgi:hypothetical protein